MNRPFLQQGLGLIEVLAALALLLLTAMAMGRLQTSSLVSAHGSSVHFSIDHLSSEMLATLRAQASDAQSGMFEFDGASDSIIDVLPEVSSWNKRVAEAIPTGVGSVSCSDGFCDVAISWIEEIDGSDHRQFYRTRTPL